MFFQNNLGTFFVSILYLQNVDKKVPKKFQKLLLYYL